MCPQTLQMVVVIRGTALEWNRSLLPRRFAAQTSLVTVELQIPHCTTSSGTIKHTFSGYPDSKCPKTDVQLRCATFRSTISATKIQYKISEFPNSMSYNVAVHFKSSQVNYTMSMRTIKCTFFEYPHFNVL
jgi:hypothetical protein